MVELSPLEIEIRRRITAAGPMPVGEYMGLCLGDPEHGYYTTRDPLGVRGDFITAPEISQMFGELIGLWMATVWTQMGSPENIRIIELGPGRGTLMNDALRAVQMIPAFREALVVHLVEISPALRSAQESTLDHWGIGVHWHPALDDVPKGPAIIVANEFFDALPVNQAVKTPRGWNERQIEVGADGKFAFTVAPEPIAHFDMLMPASVRQASEGSIYEWRDDKPAMQLGKRLADQGGAALVIDYGHTASGVGETLQAVGRHAYADPLSDPGNVDLTAHVDFRALARAVEAMGAKGYGPVDQAQFLTRLGIETRAATLKKKAPSRAAAADVDAALARLTGQGRTGMGELFKVACFAHASLGVPPGFES
jgi:NADH dehydrogenase [ubiquinone] 1 alpha subcomplex assembly factor 7